MMQADLQRAKQGAVMMMILLTGVAAGAAPPPSVTPQREEQLDAIVADAVRRTIAELAEKAEAADKKVQESDVSATVIDLSDPSHARAGSFRGDEPTFPASVVKIFYLAATHQWLEQGKLHDSEELRRAMRDMIGDSSNDATGWILEALTEAPNGPLLDEQQMRQWEHQRNAVNRYLASLGYRGINVNQKTYCEGPYGRERLFFGLKFENRNKLTTDATARLMSEIVLGRSVSEDRSKQMMELMKREIVTGSNKKNPDTQATDFTALAGLPKGTRLWSKAGWTSTARHDAAYLELPDGRRIVLVIFTLNQARERDLLPGIARRVLETLPK